VISQPRADPAAQSADRASKGVQNADLQL
jgi:hypothetical protein